MFSADVDTSYRSQYFFEMSSGEVYFDYSKQVGRPGACYGKGEIAACSIHHNGDVLFQFVI